MTRYLITGYPRSRTAWLSAWLCDGLSFCFHDGMRYCPSLDRLPKLLDDYGTDWGCAAVGNADSGLALFAEKLPALFPRTQLVLIRRDRAEALRSATAFFSQHFYRDQFAALSEEALARQFDRIEAGIGWLEKHWPTPPLILRYERLNEEAGIRRLFEFLFPQRPFNATRWQVFRDLRVNTIPENISLENFKQWRSEWVLQ